MESCFGFSSILENLEPLPPHRINTGIFGEFNILKPGNVLLFHVLRQSTIGAEGLDFRVRNGIGYYTFAIITRQQTYIKIIKKSNYKLSVNFNEFLNIVFKFFFVQSTYKPYWKGSYL